MATIKEEVDDAARECGIAPRTWLGASDTTSAEFVSMVRAVSRDLLDRHDWSALCTFERLLPSSETAEFSLPANFYRLQKPSSRDDDAVYEVTPNRRPVYPLNGGGIWTDLQAYGAAADRFYRRMATGFEFYRPLPAGSEVRIHYVKTTWVNGTANVWTTDADVPVWPSHLMRYGVIYRWRRSKGMRYADEQAEYESVLARAINDDRPIRRFGFGILEGGASDRIERLRDGDFPALRIV